MSQRSFYRRNSKIKGPTSLSTTCVDKGLGKCPVTPLRKHQRKYRGVRRLSFTTTLSDDSKKFLHGRENKLVSYLLLNEPTVLAQALSVRYTAIGQPISDFIMSLFLQGEKNRDRPKRFSTIPQSDADENNNPDVIGETDAKFLTEVLKEENHLAKRRSKERNTLVKSLPTVHNRDGCDDLHWITKEMESDCQEFLQKIGYKKSATAGNVCQPKSKRCFKSFIMLGARSQCELGCFISSEDAAFVYDVCALGRRTLGIKLLHEVSIRKRVKTLRASFEEKYRLLDMDPFRLKPNSIDNMTPFNNLAEVAMQTNELLKQVNANITTDSYFTSEKVLYPELNSFSNYKWNIVYPFPFHRECTFTLEVDRPVLRNNGAPAGEHTNLTSYQSIDNAINYCSTLLTDSPDSAFLQNIKNEIRSTFTDADVLINATNTDIDNRISAMETDICSVISSIEGLQNKVQLESRMHQIFELETHSNNRLYDLWRHQGNRSLKEVTKKVKK